ncbi:SGNH/GDSL hydrolase family protein [Catalinimonas sp. 4WD22]|uniref:SGNH/GDSL hydrolase family protein n=1 Tax=Catalinimonas locisalis TaxID=3133978 RepID=UPI0031012EE6
MNRRTFLSQSSMGALSISSLTPWAALTSKDKIKALSPILNDEPKKILFLGDSITQAGDYINFFECQLRIAQPETSFEVLNLGLGSETISGLSEENHPYPRPYLHNRLDKVLDYIQPDLIFACYGINCGIYHPLNNDRFEAYQEGIVKLMEKASQIKAELILLTPPPYAAPVQDWDKAREDQQRNDYSYAKPYAAYDDVMRSYAEWVMSIQEVQTIDIQTPMRRFKDICYGKDVIHPNQLGHQLMALTIIADYKNIKPEIQDQHWKWSAAEEMNKKDLEKAATTKTFTTQSPEINHTVLSADDDYNQLIDQAYSFKSHMTDCPEATYQFYNENIYVGQFNSQQLAQGINFGPLSDELQYQHLSFAKKAHQLYELIAAKRQIYDYALLQHIGHQRPMNREGIPITIAEEKKKALEAEMYKRLESSVWELEVIQLP